MLGYCLKGINILYYEIEWLGEIIYILYIFKLIGFYIDYDDIINIDCYNLKLNVFLGIYLI